ncbi:MAG: hypothetical protein Q4D74_01760 [Comamonadaceae bacterium]|nr:hypothetical protein [Comamonadaceae bacterium]
MFLTMHRSLRHCLIRAALGVAAACVSMGASAQAKAYRACLIESPLQTLGAPTIVTNCLQGAKGTRRSAIKDRCEGVAWHAAGGMGRDNVARLTWLAQCPRQADAVCKGAFDGAVDLYPYDRNEEQLEALADECEADGGEWHAFDE